MAQEDIILQCADCGCEFEFTVSEQEFYASKGLVNQPKRCKTCRSARKGSRGGGQRGGGGGSSQRRMYEAVCSECGGVAQVPFKPSEDRPVLCRNCYNNSY
jgi:CxxC-x17-CxxC domain-containing protein